MMSSTSPKLSTPSSNRRVTPTTGSTMRSSTPQRVGKSNRSSNTTNFGFKTLSPRLVSLRSLIGMLFLLTMALVQAEEWTLVAQKFGATRSKDACLSTIKISYNAKGKQEFRLVSAICNKRFYFAKAKIKTQNSFLDITAEDIDKVNNCVTLRMRACSSFTRVCDRRIFYLEQDGPEFMKFLIDEGKIEGVTMDHFKRQTGSVIGYTVVLMKDDTTNNFTTGLMSLVGLNTIMEQACQLRVYMNNDERTVKYFEASYLLGKLRFEITEITEFDERRNRVLLKIQRTKADRETREQRCANKTGSFVNLLTSNVPVNRWLYLGANSDSKKFLLFLMEMYHKTFTGETKVFSTAAEVSVPTIFKTAEQKEYTFTERPLGLSIKDVDNKVIVIKVTNQACLGQGIVDGSQLLSVDDLRWDATTPRAFTNTSVVQYIKTAQLPVTISFKCPPLTGGQQALKEYIGEPETDTRSGLKGLVIPENAHKFKDLCKPQRRRLVEAAYYSFIGFNMLLMCFLLVGIYFAYRIGKFTHGANYKPIRW